MKELSELNIPENLRYSEDHEWAKMEGDIIRIGISDYAQDHLGDIVYVELPSVGDKLDTRQSFGVVESVKAVSDLLIPIAGEIVAVNSELDDAPHLVSESPYDKGWMIDIKPDSAGDIEILMDSESYIAFIKGERD